MNVNAKKEKMLLNQLILKRTEMYQIEQDIIIPDIKPDILNSIMAKGIICINKKEVQNGCIIITGTINIYLMYLADDEKSNIRSIYATLEFNKKIIVPEAKENMDMVIENVIRNIECKVINGRKVNIKVNVCSEYKLYCDNNIELINEIEDVKGIQFLNKDMNINCLLGKGNVKTYAKETVSIENDDEIQEIMNADIRIINKDIKISYNKVLIKAEVWFKILYLTNKNVLKSVDSIVPIMGFIDMIDIAEDDVVDSNFCIKNMLIKNNSQEEHSIYVESEIEIQAFVYKNKRIKYIEDMYSPVSNLEFEKEEIQISSGRNAYKKDFNIVENIKVPGIRGEIYDKKILARILKTSKTSEKILYEGELDVQLLAQGENNIDVKNVVIPFDYSMDRIEKSNKEIETKIEVKKEDIKLVQEDLIETNVNLEFEVRESNIENINVMNNIQLEEKRDNDVYSLVIYYVQDGDTVWKIAKEFGSTVNDIVEINNLDNADIIQTGQKLFIPKYIEYVKVNE